MKVILLQDVKGVGKKNQTVEVAQGYGQNFLIARKLAVLSTPGAIKVKEKQIEQEKTDYDNKKKEAQEIANKMKEIVLEFHAPSSKDGRMFGAISFKQIAEELKAKHNIIIDKRKFVDKFPVNAFGYTNLQVELFKDVIAPIRVHVVEK